VATVLLDTSVASLLHPRRRSSSLRALYAPDLKGNTLALDPQTVAELWSWAEESNWEAAQREGLQEFFRRFVILPHTADLAREWARVMVHARRRGRRLEAGDAWIAAAAVKYRVPLITHDQDFMGLDLEGLSVVCRTE
jgi:tRNA(fMet)-specific endonuclease VapC